MMSIDGGKYGFAFRGVMVAYFFFISKNNIVNVLLFLLILCNFARIPGRFHLPLDEVLNFFGSLPFLDYAQ